MIENSISSKKTSKFTKFMEKYLKKLPDIRYRENSVKMFTGFPGNSLSQYNNNINNLIVLHRKNVRKFT